MNNILTYIFIYIGVTVIIYDIMALLFKLLHMFDDFIISDINEKYTSIALWISVIIFFYYNNPTNRGFIESPTMPSDFKKLYSFPLLLE